MRFDHSGDTVSVSLRPPAEDAATSVVSPPPPEPPEYEPEPSRGLGWGLLLGALVVIAVAAAGIAVYFATRDDGGPAAVTTTVVTTTAPATTTTGAGVLPAGRAFVPDVVGLKQDEAAARLGRAHLVPVVRF